MKYYPIVHRLVPRGSSKYSSLSANLISARMAMTPERYAGYGLIVSLLGGVVFAVFGFFVSLTLVLDTSPNFTGIYNVYRITLPNSLSLSIPNELISVIGAILSFIIGSLLIYIIAMKYPGMQKNNRATKINLTLHNAVAYMYAMRKGGGQLLVIFRSISDNAPVYGEVALEFRQVIRDADFFGMDVVTALRHLMETTPSQKMKQFLEDMISIIETGGDLTSFLSGRVRLYQEEARFEQKEFLQFLSLISESYVTLFVAGPLFLIIIMVVMGMMGGAAVTQMALVIYLLLPIGSLVFIILIDMISIKSEFINRFTRVQELSEYSDVRIEKKAGEEVFFEKLLHYDRIRNIKKFIMNPVQVFILNYKLTLLITVPVAAIYLITVYMSLPPAGFERFIDMFDDHVVIAALIILIPFGIFYELWRRSIQGIEAAIPDFLDRMAGINQVGLTISQAISIMVNTNLGLLSYEIKRIKRDMDWGANFTDALMRFEQRISTPMIARTVTLISKATQMSGSIGDILTIAGSDARMSETLKKERMSEMFIYTAVIYLAFIVFVFVVAVITTQFMPVLGNIDTKGLPQTGAFAGFSAASMYTISRLMYHGCLVQAFFSGIIAGLMGEASLSAGLKHAAVMLIISLL
ncbi:MAG: type II secretion system F family protein, partial [Methanomicrobiales archaeon]